MSRPIWKKYLSEGINCVWLAATHAEYDEDFSLGSPLSGGYRSLVDDLLDNTLTVEKPERAHDALSALSLEAKATLLRDLRDIVLQKGQESLQVLIPIFGPHLAVQGHWEEKVDDFVRGLGSDIVRDGGVDVLDWLNMLFGENNEVLRGAERESRLALHEHIKRRQESVDIPDDIRSLLVDLEGHVRKRVRRSRSASEKISEVLGIFGGKSGEGNDG